MENDEEGGMNLEVGAAGGEGGGKEKKTKKKTQKKKRERKERPDGMNQHKRDAAKRHARRGTQEG